MSKIQIRMFDQLHKRYNELNANLSEPRISANELNETAQKLNTKLLDLQDVCWIL